MESASQLILTTTALATILILLSPSSGAGGRPSDEAEPSTPPPAKGQGIILSYIHVHVTNDLGPDQSLTVHCQSKDDDLGSHNLDNGSEFTWRFRPRIAFGETLFWCYVAPVSEELHVRFDAYVYNDPSFIQYKHNIYWEVRPDGIYMRNPARGKEEFRHKWSSGRIAV